MAVINKIRSYSGLLIAVIGIALAAFVLGDFFGYGPSRGGSVDVGKIDKTKISYQEFEQRVNDQLEGWKMQTGNQNPGPQEAFQIRQQVWNTMLREILLDGEMEKLGIETSGDELYYLIHGPNPHQVIVRNFSNPNDGSYDPQQVINFLQNFDNLDPETQNQWLLIEQYIKRERQENKYHNLIRQGYYTPSLLLSREYQDRNATADFQYVVKRFDTLADSLVQVSDRELTRVYEENRHLYEQEASRGLQYVAFPVFPSEEDREALRNEILELQEEFANTENIQTFINSSSDERFNPTFVGQGELSPELDSVMFNSPVGNIYGPIVEENAFVMAKLTDVQFRPDSMRASHILVSYLGSASANPNTTRTLEEARILADSILGVVRRNPARFGDLAVELSDDPSAQANRGDLEWFRDFEMVPEFSEAVIEAGVNTFTTAESQFGIHVIEVTGKSAPTKKVQVAKLTRNIEPSNRTFQAVFGQASEFSALLRENKNFEEAAEEKGLSVREIEMVREMDMNLPGIENPREIVRWAFDENTKVGGFSQIFDVEDRFIVATVTEKREEGIPSLEEIRDEIQALAIREKKFETFSAEMKEALEAGNLEAIAERLQLTPEQALEIRFNMMNLPNVGPEPKVVGTAFGLQPSTISEPIKGNAGVLVVEVMNREEAVEPEDMSATRRQISSAFSNRVLNDVFNAIRENASIEDNRTMFY
ncbi:MAG: SurA N-terminal domain-containing protein [Bacteroides sp.]|jgi:peptidyl-prolyl cis-trans isomerase D|nr:SurA N-terminal domain-containing protein [Bacteroides sp.]